MSRTATETRKDVQTAKAKLSFVHLLARAFLLLWWAFVAAAAASAVQSLGNKAGPGLLALVPNLLDTLRHQPLPVQALAAVVALSLVVLTAWLTWIAFLTKRAADTEAAQQRVDEYAAGARIGAESAIAQDVTPQLGGIAADVKAGNAQGAEILVKVNVIAERLEQEAPVTPANVVAPTGLPRPLTLVGRDDELAKLTASLKAGSSTGVFAVEGMGGVGKSALAAEVVARLSDDREAFPGGAAWISAEGLEGADGLAELWARIARALRLDQVAAQTDPEARRVALAGALHDAKRTLLALDNVELGLDADAAIDTLAVPGHTALLLTARQAVAPSRLTKLELAPLPDPDAATLFKQRLRQSDDERPTPADEAEIPALVEAVGGLPLAIELTAAYAGVQHLSLARVRDELASDGLSAAAFRVEPKRAPMTRFERSWRVLSPSQQRLFAGLALLAGASFPRDAALAISKASGEDATARPDAGAQDDLAALVAYALVEPLPNERLRLHPLLREYAELRLSRFPADVSDRLGDAMVAYWLEYAQAHPDYDGMGALEAEAAGLMGAIGWAHARQRNDEVLALAHALGFAWDVRGRRSEELLIDQWAEEAVERVGDKAEQRWAADSAAITLGKMGRIAEARARYERALELAREVGDTANERRELHALAVLDWRQGKPAEARAGYERALALARQLGDVSAERAETHELAVLDDNAGNLEAARAGYEAALEIAQRLGDPSAIGSEQRDLGELLIRMGERERGLELMQEAIATFERLQAPFDVAISYEYLARLDNRAGDRDAAIAHYREALRRYAPMGVPEADRVRERLRELDAEP